MNQGWVKMHRSMLDWEWYSDINTCRLFTHLILKANHKEGKWRGILIKRGQTLTSLNTLESETGLSKSKIRTAIKKLISTREIAQQSHSQHTVFTIVNYDSYQGDDTPIDTAVTHESQTIDTRLTSNKNDKNNKNVKNDKFSKPSLQELIDYFGQYAAEKSFFINRDEPEKFYDFYESKNWLVGKVKMKNWKAAVRNWLRGNSNKPQQPQQPQAQAKAPRAFGE